MTDDQEKTMQAVILGGIIVGGIFIAAILHFIRTYEDPAAAPTRPSILSPDIKQWVEPISADDAATLGQQRVGTHASYAVDQAAPILFLQAIPISENHWSTQFRVDQLMGESIQLYHHRVEIKDGYVISHEVKVSDAESKLFLSNPEPEAVFSGQNVLVKGNTIGETQKLTLRLLDSENRTLKIQQFSASNSNFTTEISLNDQAGRYMLTISDGQQSVSVPFIYHMRAQ